jgi:hypothetical protein
MAESRLRGGGSVELDARRRHHRSLPEKPLPTLWSMVLDEDWPYDIATMSSVRSCIPCAMLARAEYARRQTACSSGWGSMTSSCGDALIPFSLSTVADAVEEACPDLGWAWDVVKRCDDWRF